MPTFEHDGKIYQDFEPEDAIAAGVPQAVVDAVLASERSTAIAAECRRRIYAEASAETQMNMTAAAAVVSAKSASSRTEADKAVLAGQEAAIGWVTAMRENVGKLSADPSADIYADANWPACPAEAAALAAQF